MRIHNQKALPLYADNAQQRIDEIKYIHGFKASTNLLTSLRHLRLQLREWYSYDAIATVKKKAFAKKIADHASALITLLQDAKDDELAHLAGLDASRPYERQQDRKSCPEAITPIEANMAGGEAMSRISERLARLSPDLQWIADRAITANMRKALRGQPQEYRLKELICGLRRVYIREFQDSAARITKTDEYSGKFFDFAAAVLPLFGEKVPQNNSLGSLIVHACFVVDAESAPGSNPK